jgi:hypothetical protein
MCSCGHVSYTHYRQRSVCRRLFCPCNRFRARGLPREVSAPSPTWASSTCAGAPMQRRTLRPAPRPELVVPGGA